MKSIERIIKHFKTYVVINMKKNDKGLYIYNSILKLVITYMAIIIFKIHVNELLLNTIMICIMIEIISTNYKKSIIKFVCILFQIYSVMIIIPLENLSNIINALLYVIVIFIINTVDFAIYIEKRGV